MTQEQDKERAQPVARGWQVEALLDGKWVPQWPVDATREAAEKSMGFFEQTVEFRVVPLYAAPQTNAALADGWMRKPLTTAQMEAGREAIFSTGNPYCPCDSKTFRKVAQWVERHHRIEDTPPTLNASKGDTGHG